MDALNEIRRPIEPELAQYRTLFLRTLEHPNALLRTALDHLAQRQGKAMRPILTLLAARYAGRCTEAVLHAAVALELLHTASLVHDDVVDESDRRRGQQSVNALLDNKVAVLVGDFLLSKALEHAARTGSPQVVLWVAELGQTLADGELQQLANTDSTLLSEEAYYEVVRKKTASLFVACARIGAFLGGGTEEDVERMAAFGDGLGVCFQLRDDIFDYDRVNEAGKPTGNDLKEGKLTLPVLHVVATGGDAEQLRVALKVRQGEASETEIEHLLTYARERGGIAYARQAMQCYAEKAVALLDEKRDPMIVGSLKNYVNFVASRSV